MVWKWDRSRLEARHREGLRWLLQMPPGCLSLWGSQCGNIYILYLFMKEMVTSRIDLWMHYQRNIWSYQDTSFTTLISAYSGPVKAASPTAVFQRACPVWQIAHFHMPLLPFTIAKLSKLCAKTTHLCAQSHLLWSTPEILSSLSSIIFPSTGLFCCNPL